MRVGELSDGSGLALLAEKLAAQVPELGVVAGEVDESAVGGTGGTRPAQRAGIARPYGTLRVVRCRCWHASTIGRHRGAARPEDQTASGPLALDSGATNADEGPE
jgi:hypothetical protein